jgi:hypothetical protein
MQPGDVSGELEDYVRELQGIAFGHDPDLQTRERLTALKLLIELGARGTTSFHQAAKETKEERTALPDDPAYEAEVARLEAELAEAKKEGRLEQLRQQIVYARFSG